MRSVWVLLRGAPHQGQEPPPLKIYFARLGLRLSFGHSAAQRRAPDQLPPLVERISIAKWGQSVQECISPFKWDEKNRGFPPSWETLAPSQHFACSLTKLARRPQVIITHPGVALLWVPTLECAPARAPGVCVFEERVGVGVHNSRVSESTDVLR